MRDFVNKYLTCSGTICRLVRVGDIKFDRLVPGRLPPSSNCSAELSLLLGAWVALKWEYQSINIFLWQPRMNLDSSVVPHVKMNVHLVGGWINHSYILIYMCVCVCVYVCAFNTMHEGGLKSQWAEKFTWRRHISSWWAFWSIGSKHCKGFSWCNG